MPRREPKVSSRGLARRAALALGVAVLATLGACSAAGPGRPDRDRPLRPIAEPGNVAAADIAFARAVRDEGGPAAFRRFAADDALVHLPGGPVGAADWLARPQDPAAPVDWEPTAVWSSCDGSTAVSFGRTRDAAGLVGSYVTAWQREEDGYRWTYHANALDDPQPPPRQRVEIPEGEDVIVVPGLDAIDGKAADCVRGAPPAVGPEPIVAANTRSEATLARDRTMRWRWEHRADSGGRAIVDYLRDGTWQEALDFAIPPPAGS